MWWVMVSIIVLAVLLGNWIVWQVAHGNIAGAPPEIGEQFTQLLTFPGGLYNALEIVFGAGLGSMLAVVLIAVMTGQEYSHRTMQSWLMRGVGRGKLLAGKTLNLLTAFVFFALIPLVVGGIITAIFSWKLNGEIGLGAVDWSDLIKFAGLTIYGLLPYAALTFMLAIVTRSVVIALGITIGYNLIIELVLQQTLPALGETATKIAAYLPSNLVQGLMQADGPGFQIVVEGQTPLAPTYLEPNQAAIGIAIYLLIFAGIAAWRFSKQDLSG